MDRLRIVGGQRLEGAVTISGAKNAALPQIAAALLSPYPLELTNLPDVTDVENMLGVVRLHGAEVTRSAHAATIDTSAAVSKETSYDTVRKMRATVLVLAPLLARFGHARVSLPGGCAIGARPVDMHVAALAALGARIAIENGSIVASAPNGLTGTRIVLSSPSVGATETAMMAAATAKGETEILNAAREPEVADLAACLNAMGARIEGAGTHRILIAGGTSWHARQARHHSGPDRGRHLCHRRGDHRRPAGADPCPARAHGLGRCNCWRPPASASGRATAGSSCRATGRSRLSTSRRNPIRGFRPTCRRSSWR